MRFHTSDGREFFAVALPRPTVLQLPFEPEPYPCLLWDHRGGWTRHERDALTSSIINTDCRYAVCGGVECEQWHDETDRAFLTAVPEQESEARFIMTSWHTDESPLDVALFFVWNTNFDLHDFRRFVLVEIGVDAPSRDLLEAVTRSATEPSVVVDELDARDGVAG